jgi:hypothetical protein
MTYDYVAKGCNYETQRGVFRFHASQCYDEKMSSDGDPTYTLLYAFRGQIAPYHTAIVQP